MRAFLIDGKTDECKEIEVKPTLSEYYRLIGCDCIDIAVREIDGTPFNIVLDDEGLLKPNRITGTNLSFSGRLVGTLLIFGVDDMHDLRSLTDEEVLMIRRRIVQSIFADGSEHPVLWYTR